MSEIFKIALGTIIGYSFCRSIESIIFRKRIEVILNDIEEDEE